ncbi:MAG: T9SS type A sorting domain-containing protein [Ignavibacteria bacterium]|nr:T9SS type A sorting domain-containing protein [Ignavibacteria bacterium]
MKKKLLILFVLFIASCYPLLAQLSSPILVEPPKETSVARAPVTLDWQDVAGAVCYRVEVYTDTTSPDKFEGTCNSPTSHFDIPATETEMNTKYYWRVFACSPGGWSAPSGYFSFKTQAVDAIGSVGNLTDGVIDLIADEEISQNQGNILINRLHSVENRLNQGNKFMALVNMVLFKARVLILRISNQINLETYKNLNYSSDGVIDLIVDEEERQTAGTRESFDFTDLTTPKSYELSQNYPNPFNPSTTIEFSVPKDAAVTLKIYDVLGKEVATLVNEQKPTGTYIVNWNASNFSSGLYFYKLTAGDFNQTKKMFLVK